MQIKMKEHYKDKNNQFAPEQVVDVGQDLGLWLVKHGKAVQVKAEPKPEPHYGAQSEPEFRHDDEKAPEQLMTSQNVKKPHRGRGKKK